MILTASSYGHFAIYTFEHMCKIIHFYIFEEMTLCIPFWENFPWMLKCLKRLVYSISLINMLIHFDYIMPTIKSKQMIFI